MNNIRPLLLLRLASAAVLLSLFTLLTPLNAKVGSKLVYPSDDRWTNSAGTTGQTPLQIANPTVGTTIETYLQFEVKGLRFAVGGAANPTFPSETYGNVTQAILKLTKTTGSTAANVQVFAIDNYNKAANFTWGGRPGAKGLPSLAGAPGNTATLSFDVTDYITGEGRYSFVVRAPAGTSLTFAANESGTVTSPVLTVDYDDGGDTAPLDGVEHSAVVARTVAELSALSAAVRGRYGLSTPTVPDPDITNLGILDVTSQPYGAKGDSSTDDTLAIQRAVNEARAARLALYFPPGTYIVTDTVQLEQHTVPITSVDSGEIPDVSTDNTTRYDNELWDRRDYACVLRGAMGTSRATIKLVPGATDLSFNSTQFLKPVLYFWSHNNTADSGGHFQSAEENLLGVNYNHVFTDIDVNVTSGGRVGAVAISMAGAQGTRISNVTINQNGAFAGLGGLPAPGGSVFNVTINSGKHAVYTTLSAMSPALAAQTGLLTACTFQNQTDKSIVYAGAGSLTVVGSRILNSLGVRLAGTGGQASVGSISVIDSHIKLVATAGPDDAAITGDRNVYLSNVIVESVAGSLATQKIVNVAGQHSLSHAQTGAGSRVTKVGDYAGSIIIDQDGGAYPAALTLVSSWVGANTGVVPRNSPLNGTDHVWSQNIVLGAAPTATDVMFTRHLPDVTPDFITAYNPVAAGLVNPNDMNDDRAALQTAINTHTNVFLPAGTYYLSAPLNLQPNTKLFGIDKSFVVIKSLWNTNTASAFNTATEVPLIRTTTGATDSPLLADLQLRTRCSSVVDLGAYLLNWQAGQGTVRDVMFDRRKMDQIADGNQNYPAVIITGNGGGNWYNFWMTRNFADAGYRHLVIRGTTGQKLRFYMLNTEYGKAHPQVEITNSSKIDIFATKAEGNYRHFAISGSSHFRIFGLGGNQSPFPSDYLPEAGFNQSIFIGNCHDFLIANQNYQIRSGIDTNYTLPEGAKTDPQKFDRIKDINLTGGTDDTTTPGVEQFVVYRRGNPIP